MNPQPNQVLQRQAATVVKLVQQIAGAVAHSEPADRALRRVLRQHPEFGGRDRRFYSEMVFSYFRWKGWMDSLSFLGPEAVCALSYLMDAPRTNALVLELAERGGLAGRPLSPLQGRSVDDKGAALRASLGEKLPPYLPAFAPSLDPLVPGWVKAALHHPAKDAQQHFRRCLEAFQVRPPTWLSIRPGYEEAVQVELAATGAAVIRHPRLTRALAVPGSPDLAPLRAKLGNFFLVQDLASQCVGLCCAPQPGQSWWDVCAGAGGKTLLLLELMQDRGSILATDRRAKILGQLQLRAREAGFRSFATGVLDATRVSPSDIGFDGVLVDAPCTALGTWSRNPDARWRTDAAEVERKATIQARLLRRAAEKVRPGGRLVYAVCTLTHAETVGLVDAFLSERREFSLEAMVHPLTGEPSDGKIWVWPWDGPCDGMFVAGMTRRA